MRQGLTYERLKVEMVLADFTYYAATALVSIGCGLIYTDLYATPSPSFP